MPSVKPDFIGSKIFYNADQAAIVEIDSTAVAANDVAAFDNIASLYTPSAAVDHHRTSGFTFVTAAANGADLTTLKRFGYGVFLTPQYEVGNLLFQLSADISIQTIDTDAGLLNARFVFGRSAISSVTGAEANALADFQYIPATYYARTNHDAVRGCSINMGIESQVFSINVADDSDAKAYAFGVVIDNRGANTLTLMGGGSLSLRKYNNELSVYHPSL